MLNRAEIKKSLMVMIAEYSMTNIEEFDEFTNIEYALDIKHSLYLDDFIMGVENKLIGLVKTQND